MKVLKPKFNIDDIITLHDDFVNNPSRKTIFIGKIQSIYVHKRNNSIYYDVANYSLGNLKENELKLYKGIIK